MKMKLRIVIIAVVLLAMFVFLGMRLYAQLCHINIYVSRNVPMPAELAAGLHMKEHGISETVRIDSPYDRAENKMLSLQEIGQIRSKLAWSKSAPILIDSLFILSSNHVATRRQTSRFIEECDIVKENNEWVIKSGTRTDVNAVKVFQ